VAVGGRSLSIAAGLLSESTVWAVLRLLRETPGSPLLLIRKGSGLVADSYALTQPSILDPAPAASGRPMVRDVHPAWAVIGYQHGRVFEVIAETGVTVVHAICEAARMSTSAAYESVAELARHGLIVRTHGSLKIGPTTLDDIATRYRLDEERAQRISQHRTDRQAWQQWLSSRRDAPPTGPIPSPPANPVVHFLSADDELIYRQSVMATGPPELASL